MSFIVHAQELKDWSSCVTPEGVPTLKCLEIVLGNIITMSSALILVVIFFMFVVGSVQWLTSGGSPEKLKKAKGVFTWAIVGTILFISSFLIIKIIDTLFLGGQGDLFRFEIPEF